MQRLFAGRLRCGIYSFIFNYMKSAADDSGTRGITQGRRNGQTAVLFLLMRLCAYLLILYKKVLYNIAEV